MIPKCKAVHSVQLKNATWALEDETRLIAAAPKDYLCSINNQKGQLKQDWLPINVEERVKNV